MDSKGLTDSKANFFDNRENIKKTSIDPISTMKNMEMRAMG